MATSWIHYSADQRNDFFAQNDVDCKFLVGIVEKERPTEIQSYKFILTSISPVFERMLNGFFIESKSVNGAIVINDISAEDFRNFLVLAYYQKITKRKNFNWKGVYDVAKKYLAETIIGFIICELGHHIICKPNPFDNLTFFEIVHLEGKTSLFCATMETSVIKAFKMHSPQIYQFDRPTFQSLYKIVKHIDPLIRFRVLENYCILNDITRANAKNTTENSFIESCLELIDFAGLGLKDYIDFVENSKLLSLESKYEILFQISEKLAFKLPDEY